MVPYKIFPVHYGVRSIYHSFIILFWRKMYIFIIGFGLRRFRCINVSVVNPKSKSCGLALLWVFGFLGNLGGIQGSDSSASVVSSSIWELLSWHQTSIHVSVKRVRVRSSAIMSEMHVKERYPEQPRHLDACVKRSRDPRTGNCCLQFIVHLQRCRNEFVYRTDYNQ